MKKYIVGIFGMGLLLSACQKKVEPVDTFSVNVDFKQAGAKQLTGDVELNPKDSIYFNFTVTSPTDMAFVEIQKNGARIDTFRLNATNNKSFSMVRGYMADSIPGEYTYRVLARNSRAVFLGDGGKQIKVTIKPDFNFWSFRILSVPDTVAKTNKTYYSTSDGKTYSYSEGAANSAKIDFGYYFDTTGQATSSTTDDLGHTIYALNSAQPQLSYYDISSWTKNATVFKKMPASGTGAVNFGTGLTSGGAINTLIRNSMATGTASKVTGLSLTNSGSTSNSVIGFRTADGKFGAILVRFIRGNSPSKETAIELDVKVQK